MPNRLSITNKLFEKKLLTEEQRQQVELEYANQGKSEEEILLSLKLVSEEDLAKAKGEIFNVPYVKLAEVGFAPEVLTLLPRSVAERYTLIPFSQNSDGKEISVALADPLNLEAIEFVEARTE